MEISNEVNIKSSPKKVQLIIPPDIDRIHSNPNNISDNNNSVINLNENLLSKVNIFTQRIKQEPVPSSRFIKKEVRKEEEIIPSTSTLRSIRKTVFGIMASPLEEEDDNDDVEEKNQKKVEFNKSVEDMAQYYIKETEISSFYIGQFLEIVTIHILYFFFGPLIIPILLKIWGKILLRNMGLWGKRFWTSHAIQISYWISFVLTIIFTFIIQVAEKSSSWNNQLVFLSPAYISQIMVLIRYLTVSVKYGFFPREYYKKWKTTRLTRTEVKSNFLLQGWIKPSLLVLDVYLKEIFMKFNIDVNKFKFHCAGKISEGLKNSLFEVDELINEDAKKMRRSIFRKYQKETSFFDLIKKIVCKNNKIKNEEIESSSNRNRNRDKVRKSIVSKRESIMEINQSNRGSIELTDIVVSEACETENDIDKEDIEDIENKANPQDDKPARRRLKEFIVNRIIPDVKKRIQFKNNSLDSKVKSINDNSYEIKGIYLCRIILKDVITVKFENYAVMHKIFVFMIILVPFIFTYTYYIYFNNANNLLTNSSIIVNQASNLTSLNQTATVIATSNSTNTTSIINKNTITITEQISFNYLSIILLIFSAASLIPPVWLNTLNLLYGIVDIQRKIKLMQILTELINSNLKLESSDYPILNTTHPNTILNWYYLRNIVMSFGKRFGDRIILQTSIFCLFVVIALLISILSLFGLFNQFIALCLGVSFTFSVLINFMIIFYMFFLGADFNYYENLHGDMMMTHKLFVDELINNSKISKMLKKSSQSIMSNMSTSSVYFQDSITRSRNSTSNSFGSNDRNDAKNGEVKFMISNNVNSELFVKIILSDENLIKLKEHVTYLNRAGLVLENIKEKIKIDAIVRPLKIFWVKADYALVGKIIAIIGTGLGMIAGNVMTKVDISKFIK